MAGGVSIFGLCSYYSCATQCRENCVTAKLKWAGTGCVGFVLCEPSPPSFNRVQLRQLRPPSPLGLLPCPPRSNQVHRVHFVKPRPILHNKDYTKSKLDRFIGLLPRSPRSLGS